MLRKIICQVVGAAAPVDEKLALVDTVTDPVKTHVDSFGAALLDGVVGNPSGTGIVCLDRSGVLGVAHAFESVTKHGAILGIVKQGT